MLGPCLPVCDSDRVGCWDWHLVIACHLLIPRFLIERFRISQSRLPYEWHGVRETQVGTAARCILLILLILPRSVPHG